MSTFDSTKTLLPEILKDIVDGKIQLPDFQRGWVWDDEHIKGLLISIARSFPIGAVMLLETGGEVKFQIRLVQGVGKKTSRDAELLILDGQQRLTTLTQVLKSQNAVQTRNEKKKAIERFYYFHIPTALEGEDKLEDSIVAVDSEKMLRSNFGRDIELDLSTREKECEQLYFPCNEILNSDAWEQSLHQYNPEKFPLYMDFRSQVLDAFRQYQVPIIELKKETPKEAVCLVFEKVNTGGVPLSVFELMTASYAAEGYNLRDDWHGSEERKVESRKKRLAKEDILASVEATDFLQSITMLQTLEKRKTDIKQGLAGKQVSPVSAKRAAVLSLDLSAYKNWADKVENGFMLAAKFLRKECFFYSRDLPYRTQLLPLASVLAIIGNRWLEQRIYEKLSRWFWCGVLGELYGGAVDTRIANDVEELLNWIDDDSSQPRTVTDASFDPDRLDRLTSRLSAAYKGINTLVLRSGAKDFFWVMTIQEMDAEDLPLDIHHIFPEAWCKERNIDRQLYNSIVNKTPISAKTNRMIGGIAPSEYLNKLQKHEQVQHTDEDMNKILESHLISPAFMRADDFYSYHEKRKRSLLSLISKTMGKKIEYAEKEIPLGA